MSCDPFCMPDFTELAREDWGDGYIRYFTIHRCKCGQEVARQIYSKTPKKEG